MTIWQADISRRPLVDRTGQTQWELVLCSEQTCLVFSCPQTQVNSQWLTQQLQQINPPPELIQVFRPQCLRLIQAVGQQLGIPVVPSRRVDRLKQYLQSQDYRNHQGYTGESYQPLVLDRPAPVPLPENLWGDRWQFAALSAGQLWTEFSDRSVRIKSLPAELNPLHLGLASTVAIPGVIIEGGRQSLPLARWLETAQPAHLDYVPGEPDGLILEAGLVDRWIIATFNDLQVRSAAQTFMVRQRLAKGLHFLLIQPDSSGMTWTGIWLLQKT